MAHALTLAGRGAEGQRVANRPQRAQGRLGAGVGIAATGGTRGGAMGAVNQDEGDLPSPPSRVRQSPGPRGLPPVELLSFVFDELCPAGSPIKGPMEGGPGDCARCKILGRLLPGFPRCLVGSGSGHRRWLLRLPSRRRQETSRQPRPRPKESLGAYAGGNARGEHAQGVSASGPRTGQGSAAAGAALPMELQGDGDSWSAGSDVTPLAAVSKTDSRTASGTAARTASRQLPERLRDPRDLFGSVLVMGTWLLKAHPGVRVKTHRTRPVLWCWRRPGRPCLREPPVV